MIDSTAVPARQSAVNPEMKLGQFLKEDAIRWIHSVEYGRPVRMTGLITELYFSKKLRDAMSRGKFSCVAEGWFYTKAPGANEAQRHWYRLADHSSKPSAVEEVFIKKLSSMGHRFFFLQWAISVAGVLENERPHISITAIEWLTKEETFSNDKTPACTDLENRINHELSFYLSKVVFAKTRGWNVNPPFSEWFQHVEMGSLASLLVQRSLMNSSVATKPLDLDAMALDRSGRLVFIEFKRKYPTKGGSRPKEEKYHPGDYFAFAAEMQNALEPCGSADVKSVIKKFNEECVKRNFRYERIPSFGLDMHHFQTILLCAEADIDYRYVIWNEGQSETKQSRSLPDVVCALKKILDTELCPVQKPVWWLRSLCASDVKGLTFTTGDDSGSYSKNIRLQVIFDE